MSTNLKIEGIITHNIFTERNIITWDEYKNNILNNFNSINFNEQIENYTACNKSLYVTRPRMRTILYNSIVLNSKIFMEIGYNSYKPREGYIITHKNIYDFIEECVVILVEKQKSS